MSTLLFRKRESSYNYFQKYSHLKIVLNSDTIAFKVCIKVDYRMGSRQGLAFCTQIRKSKKIGNGESMLNGKMASFMERYLKISQDTTNGVSTIKGRDMVKR